MLKIDLTGPDGRPETLAFALVPSKAWVVVLVRDDGTRFEDNDYWSRIARTLRRELVRRLDLQHRRLILIEEVLFPGEDAAWVNHFFVWEEAAPVLHFPCVMQPTDPLVAAILKLRDKDKAYRAMRTWLDRTLQGQVSP